MTRILLLLVTLASSLALLACGDDASDSPATAATETQATETGPAPAQDSAPRGPLLKLRDSQLGPVLFSGSDRALYTFTRDRSGDEPRSRCYGDCAEAWPPYFAKARPRAGRGVKQGLLGTIRRGSRRQVTYRGQPLYFYEHDPRGQVLCNDIVEFGGTWFAVTAEGKPPA
jgi:predicted lipoprotein with Yx(FWY)xxD motif